jgi:adenylosuccinate lyase
MLALTTELVETLVVYPDRMLETIERSHGVIYSQAVLLELVRKGMTREDAYAVVQAAAMRSWESGHHLRTTLADDPTVRRYLDDRELDDIFRGERSLTNIPYLYKRCGFD